MTDANASASTASNATLANAQREYVVHRADLPLSCPLPSMALWNSHPRVYLPIQDDPDHQAQCPYCGAVYQLAD